MQRTCNAYLYPDLYAPGCPDTNQAIDNIPRRARMPNQPSPHNMRLTWRCGIGSRRLCEPQPARTGEHPPLCAHINPAAQQNLPSAKGIPLGRTPYVGMHTLPGNDNHQRLPLVGATS